MVGCCSLRSGHRGYLPRTHRLESTDSAPSERALSSPVGGHPLPRYLAIVMAMSSAEHLPLADVKNRLSEVVDRLEREHGRVVVTKHGRPAAVMLSVEDLESLEETLEILSNPRLLEEIRKGERDVKAGRKERLSREELLARRGER